VIFQAVIFQAVIFQAVIICQSGCYCVEPFSFFPLFVPARMEDLSNFTQSVQEM